MNFNFDDLQSEDINLDELKNITAKAQNAKREEENRKRREEMQKAQMELEKKQNEAKAIIQTIPYKVKQAASERNNSVCIIELKYDDFKRTYSYQDKNDPKSLDTKAKIIWDFLFEKGLNPTFYTAHDGYGEKSWDYIKANW